MEFRDVMRTRRMVRSFRPDPLDAEVLDRVLWAGRKGPSAGFTQGVDLVVLEGAEQTARYWDIALPVDAREGFPWPRLVDAPVLVLVLSDKEAYLDRYAEPDKGWTDRSEDHWPIPYWDVDAGMAAMLMLLAAVDEGLGAVFFGVFRGWEEIRSGLGIPEHLRCVGVIALGHAAEGDRPSGSLARGRRPEADVVHRGRW